MSLKTVKVHITGTRESAVKIADNLRNECKPCSDPCPTLYKNMPMWQVSQYVTTGYPEI